LQFRAFDHRRAWAAPLRVSPSTGRPFGAVKLFGLLFLTVVIVILLAIFGFISIAQGRTM